MTHTSATIQMVPEAMPSTPSWFGEVATFAQVFQHMGQLEAMKERVQNARARFGHYDTIDFVIVLIGYAVSEELTLKAFKVFLVQLSSHNRMEHCVAPLIVRSIHKNGAPNATVLCGFCMPHALAIVALAFCVCSVKKAALRSHLDG